MKLQKHLRLTILALPVIMVALLLILIQEMFGGTTKLAIADQDGHSHFRFGHITWQLSEGDPAHTVKLTFIVGFRRSGFSCRNPETGGVVACGGTDGLPVTGDIFLDILGDTNLNFGDGTSTNPLYFKVFSYNVQDDWVMARALHPGTNNLEYILKTYTGGGPYIVYSESCCRIFEFSGPNHHVNNPSKSYRIESEVDFNTTASPISLLPPIVDCYRGMPCEFTVPAVDPDAFDPEQANLRWRLADPLEMGGPNLTQPVGATINELTGFFAWDTSAITFTEGYHNLYSTQVIIEDTTSGPQPQPISKVALDFFIRIVDLPGPPADIIQIPLRWCGMSGSPSMMQPSYYFNLQTHNAVLLKRMREVNDNIFYHQAGIQFISGARFSDFDFPIIVGENPDGHFRASMAGTDRDRAVNLCRLEWRDEDPAVTGMVAVNLNRFIDSTGVPTDTIVGIARVTNPLDPGLQLLMGVATVSDWAYLVEQPDGGLPTPRLYYDPNQKWLGHELGHGLSLEQTTTDKHLHDGQNLMDNEDYYAIEIKPYQREHIRIQASYIPDIKLGSIPRKFVASTWPDTLDDTPVSEAFIDMDTIGIGVDQDLSKTHLAASTFSLFPDNITGLNYYFSIDLDNNSSTGGSPGVVGVPGDAQGIELVGRVQVDVTAGVAQGTPFVWKFQDGQFVQVTDPSIQAIVETAYDTAASTFQTTQGPTPKGQIIQLLLSNDLRGPFADDIRFVANAENSSTGTVDSVEGSITFVPPTFPTCQVDPDSALLGSTVNVSASSLPANHAFSVFLGTQQVATGTTDIAGNVNINFAIPMDTTAGTRPVSVYADGTAVAADCVIQLWSGPKFDVPPSPASGSAFTINAGETLTFTVQASDADAASGDVITLDVIDLPAGASFPVPAPSNPAAATFSWTPTNDQVGSYVVLFTARDSFGLAATPLSVTITVQSGLVSCTPSNQFNASQTSLQPTSISLASSSLTNFSGLPLAFVPNRGQTDNTVRFQVRGLSGILFFTPGEVSISLPNPLKVPAENDEEREEVRFDLLPPSVVRIHYQGADPHPEISATDALPGVVNYLLGDDPANWRTNLPTYAGIAYREIYPGIELKYEGTDGVLKSAFNVAPGADPAAIRWRYTGATGMSLDESGNLVVDLPAPMQGRDGITLIERAPTAWQVVDETRVMVPVNYSLNQDGTVGFLLPNGYDPAWPLVIDPVLTYSTYLGGGHSDQGLAITLDGQCNAYITGSTHSSNFPTVNPVQGNQNGDDVFVSKLNDAGDTLLYSTYIGGIESEHGYDIALDNAGRIVVAGETESSDFPIVNGYQATFGGGMCGDEPCDDFFVTQLAADGSAILYSTFLGGNAEDDGLGVAVGANGYIYVVGVVESTSMPTLNPFQAAKSAGEDAYLAVLDPAQTGSASLRYASYLGGGDTDTAYRVRVNSAGHAYVVGYTKSTNFPTLNPYQASRAGNRDVFVAKFDPLAGGSASLLYSTYFGGSQAERGFDLALGGADQVYVTGFTLSGNFPLANAFDNSYAGGTCGTRNCYDAFAFKLDLATNTLAYSTYLGGSGDDEGNGVTVDGAGNAYLTGYSKSTDFPVASAIQPTKSSDGCSAPPCADAFVTKLDASGSGLVYSTYLGGSGDDYGQAIVLDGLGGAYITGFTLSGDFPTTPGSYDTAIGSTYRDAFVLKISD